MKQISYFVPERLDISINGIQDTINKQSLPFLEGDTISFFLTIQPSNGQENVTGLSQAISSRKYRIILYL